MINTNVFNHINMLKTTADASWRRNEVVAHNIANNTTPGYKRKDINFEEQLRREIQRKGGHRNVDLSRLNARVYTDKKNFSYRLDGNNVDPENEAAILAANQLKYNGLIEIMNRKFSGLRSVMQK